MTSSAEQTTYSLFYGHDQRADNLSGAAPELKYGATTVIRFLSDIDTIPVSFEQESLIAAHRRAFESLNVRIHEFINIVYLIYHFVDTNSTITSQKVAEPRKRENVEVDTAAAAAAADSLNMSNDGSLPKKRM